MELSNPFPHNESFVHIWQGFEDPLVPVKLQQYVCRKLQWIRYHEVTDGGHLIMYDTNLFEAILRELLLPSGSDQVPFFLGLGWQSMILKWDPILSLLASLPLSICGR
ncbi:hypothetical protein POTOM_035153 [Populus tomentosa]|uniref:Alpha/beta-Hydrolases superfamily protein n=1 Tax=Populus tomentosa TaxID=118781 RepID=A0A8X7Z6M5_POPTO|nr:hypothetical protein POTOM_035153 [Populus tomentosa]